MAAMAVISAAGAEPAVAISAIADPPGNGGFGGGGGGGAFSPNGTVFPGGSGGFGGGGGGPGQNGDGPGSGGSAGFGAGGGDYGGGGGGLGAGGAIFARAGSTLSIQDCSFSADTTIGGSSPAYGPFGGSAMGQALFLGGNLTYSVSSGTNTLAETIGGGDDPNARGSLSKSGAGTLVLSATNTYVGSTTIDAGTLRIINQILGSSMITINSNAVLEYNYSSELSEPATTYNGAGTLRITGTGEVVFGPGLINVDLSPGAWIDVQGGKLFGSSGYAGNWTANQSSMNIAAGAEFDAVEAGPSGTLQIDALTGAGSFLGGYSGNRNGLTSVTLGVAGGSGTFSGTLQDEINAHLGIIKVGLGAEVFSGTNTYTGGTLVEAGTLVVNGSISSGSVIVSGGTWAARAQLADRLLLGPPGSFRPAIQSALCPLIAA